MSSLNVSKVLAFGAGNVLVVTALSLLRKRFNPTLMPGTASTDGWSGKEGITTEAAEEEDWDCSACAKSLANSVKTIDMHIIICSPGPWIKRVESEEGSFVSFINTMVSGTLKDNNLSKKVKLTACDRASGSPDFVDVIVYPHAQMYRLAAADRATSSKAFVDHILLGKQIEEQYILVEDLPWAKLVLVCNHAARDKRCGKAGPIILDEFRKQLKSSPNENSVAIFGTSHIGGHEFAGTLIIYPEGQCFGYITKSKVGALLDYVCTGSTEAFSSISERCYRGQFNETW